ncbi:hypothetical protein LguiA_025643 [Lonicera macranthoides]
MLITSKELMYSDYTLTPVSEPLTDDGRLMEMGNANGREDGENGGGGGGRGEDPLSMRSNGESANLMANNTPPAIWSCLRTWEFMLGKVVSLGSPLVCAICSFISKGGGISDVICSADIRSFKKVPGTGSGRFTTVRTIAGTLFSADEWNLEEPPGRVNEHNGLTQEDLLLTEPLMPSPVLVTVPPSVQEKQGE